MFLKAVENKFHARRDTELVEDGLDAIATGVAGIIAFTYITLPASFIDPFARVAAAALAGACAGFLPSNWPSARIYLGDGGSTLLGACLAFLGLDLCSPHPARTSSLVFPLILAAVPLLDAVFAAIRRIRSRTSVLKGDRRHTYDLMRARGWSVRTIALSFYAITGVFALIGYCLLRNPSPQTWIAAAITIGMFLCIAIRVGSLRVDDGDQAERGAMQFTSFKAEDGGLKGVDSNGVPAAGSTE